MPVFSTDPRSLRHADEPKSAGLEKWYTWEPRGTGLLHSPHLLLSDLPTEPRPTVAELQPTPPRPGPAASPGPRAGSCSPGEPRGARHHSASPAGHGHPAELPAWWHSSSGYAPQPLPFLSTDAPALPVPGTLAHGLLGGKGSGRPVAQNEWTLPTADSLGLLPNPDSGLMLSPAGLRLSSAGLESLSLNTKRPATWGRGRGQGWGSCSGG